MATWRQVRAEAYLYMNKKPIFIHSLFRTGSTYAWNKFRQNDRYYCYYEPFHQALGEITPEAPCPWSYDSNTTDGLRHPRVEKNYLFEYKKLLRPGETGVPFFKKSFSFDDFCNNDDNPDQKQYIDFLIESSGDKIPVFQFNRSALRVKWFKRNYPGAVNIYLVRNPRDQFQSYMSMWEENQLDIFLAMDLLVTGLNLQSEYFNPLAGQVPMFEFRSPLFSDEQFIYSRLLPLYSTAEKYYIFYFTWFTALFENAWHADFLLNIDLLSSSEAYRLEVTEVFKTYGIQNIDFSDARIRGYEKTGLSKKEMRQIEETVRSLIIKKYPNKDIDGFHKKIDHHNRDCFKLDIPELYRLKNIPSPKIDMGKALLKKYQLLFNHFSRELVNHYHQLRELQEQFIQKDQQLKEKDRQLSLKDQQLTQKEQELAQKDQQLVQKDQQLRQTQEQLLKKEAYIKKIFYSKSYRLGRFMISPLRLLKRIIKKDKK